MFEQALGQSTADERAHWGMAEVLWEQAAEERAIAHMTQAAQLSGQNPDMLVRLGEMHATRGQLDIAAVQAEAALAMDRQHARAWALKGRVLKQQGEFHEALDGLQRALIHDPYSSDVRVQVAEIYAALGQPQRAMATIDQLADHQPTEAIPARAWMLKGQALAGMGQSQDATECLRQAALCADDQDHELLLELAQQYFSAGESAEARFLLGKVLKTNPNNPQARQFQNQLSASFAQSSPPVQTYPVSTPKSAEIESK